MSDDKLTDEDKALFRQVMSTVKPLANNSKFRNKDKPPLKLATPKIPTSPEPKVTHHLSNYYNEPVSSEAILSYCKQSIPHQRLSQLKNGKIPWEARLDLHGLRPDAAEKSLCHFIAIQHQKDNRCLLIIHGKGGHHFDTPVLKNLVNHWLKQLPEVLAFHSALPRDGGSGALYVLLQRTR